MDAKDKEIAELKHRLADTERKRLAILPFVSSENKYKTPNKKMSDKVLEAKIVAAVSKAMRTYCEKWVTAEVLCEHVGTLTPRFLKDHGKMFNRTQVIWRDPQGVEHAQGWLYPLHEILEMVEDGRIKELKETTK